MTAFVIVDLSPKDGEKLASYSGAAAPTIETYGGRIVSKGSPIVLHGGQAFQMKAVIEFPSRQSALDWYGSSDYQALIAGRNEAMDSQFHLLG